MNILTKSLIFLASMASVTKGNSNPYHVTWHTLNSSVSAENQKTLIWMHGAGENATFYLDKFKSGEYHQNKDVKIMFLQSGLKQDGRTPWMKNNAGKGHMDPDARNITDADMQSESIVKIIRDEIKSTYGHLNFKEGAKRIYLGGKSQGALLTLYIQLMKLDNSLGGAAVCSGFPLKPLLEMTYSNVTKSEARKECTDLKKDMRFFIWHGEKDTVFDQVPTFKLYDELFEKLGVNSTIKVMHHEPGLTHETSATEMKHLMAFMDEQSSMYP